MEIILKKDIEKTGVEVKRPRGDAGDERRTARPDGAHAHQ